MPAERRVRRALKIAEISGVDRPAQEGARALIMKRHEPGEDVGSREALAKSAALTTAVDGHTHVLYTSGTEGEWDSGTTSYHEDHSHPWVRTADGSIVIGEARGHTHEVAAVTKTAGDATQEAGGAGENVVQKEAPMPDDTKKAAPTVEQLQKQLERSNKVAELSDAEKAHFKGLDAAGQDAFLAKSADERRAVLDEVAKRASEADPVVYKTTNGIELRKSAGEAFIAMARSNDALRKRNDELVESAAAAELRKRAEVELSHLPGDVEARVALLKSVEGIQDEAQRAAALNALKAQNLAMAKAFDVRGHGGSPLAKSTDDELDALAKKYQVDNPGVTYEKAYAAVLDTPAGQEIYAKSLN